MENAFDHSFFGILLSLAEVSVSLTAFAGIVVAVGRRSSGEWSLIDRTRFAQVISNGVFALLFCLLPFLIIDPNNDLTEDSWSSTLIFVGILGLIEFQYRFRRAWPVIKAQLDEDSGTGFQWLPWAYSGFSFFTYVMLFLVIFDVNSDIEIFFSFDDLIILSSISVIFLTYITDLFPYLHFRTLNSKSKTTKGLAFPMCGSS